MPTVMSHAVVGLALGTATPYPRQWRFWVISAVLPVLPDLDVLGLPFGVPFLSMWGHRGITHSFVGAAIIGMVAAALTARALGARVGSLAAYFTVVTASHGLLDALTNGGPGVAFLAPFDDTRYFFPWRPVPVSPLAANFFSEWGWRVFRAELLLLWLPSLALAALASLARRARRA